MAEQCVNRDVLETVLKELQSVINNAVRVPQSPPESGADDSVGTAGLGVMVGTSIINLVLCTGATGGAVFFYRRYFKV